MQISKTNPPVDVDKSLHQQGDFLYSLRGFPFKQFCFIGDMLVIFLTGYNIK